MGGYGWQVVNVGGRRSGGEVRKSWYVVLKKASTIPNVKMFTIQRKKSWYVVLKKLAPISNLKMFTIERKKSWYVVLKKS